MWKLYGNVASEPILSVYAIIMSLMSQLRRFTTTTTILFVFAFIFKFCNPSEV